MKNGTFIKIFVTFFIVLLPAVLFGAVEYTVLAPIGDVGGTQVVDENYLSLYLNNVYMLGVALCSALAVLMIIIGGVQWSSSDSWTGKKEGLARIQAALLGLVIALGSYVLLNTVNPDLLDTRIGIPSITNNTVSPIDVVSVPGEEVTPGVPTGEVGGNINGKPVAGEAEGRATNFGYNDSQDNGRGTPRLDPKKGGSGINTNNTTVRGVALPESVLEQALGIPRDASSWDAWAPARRAGVYVYDPGNPSKNMIVPIVDLGPGAGPQSRGVVIDETHAVNQYFGGDGARGYKIIPNYYGE